MSYTTYDVYFYEMYYLEYSLFWKLDKLVFDYVKCTIVGMFDMRWLHTAVWGGHNYAFMADVIVRKMIIVIIFHYSIA